MEIVGIAGGSASGKTVLADAIQISLGSRCVRIAHDRYYRAATHLTADLPNFDHPDALDTDALVADLEALAERRPIRLRDYDMESHRPIPTAHWRIVQPAPVVLVEGILVLATECLRRKFHKSVFVDTPADIRLIRRIRRDLADRGRTVHEVLDQYMFTVRPMHCKFVEPSMKYADLVVDGTLPIPILRDTVLQRFHLTSSEEP